MFSNIGKKLMTLAKVCYWITFASCMILFLSFLDNGNYVSLGWLLIGVVSVTFFWPLYGFGQLIDDVHAIRNQNTAPVDYNDELPRL